MFPGLSMVLAAAAVDVVSGLNVTATPTTARRTQSTSGGGPVTLTTPTVTAEAAGGVGPYTYAWTRISGDSAITATAPSAATTAFTASLAVDETKIAMFRVTATDTATGATATADVSVILHLVSLL